MYSARGCCLFNLGFEISEEVEAEGSPAVGFLPSRVRKEVHRRRAYASLDEEEMSTDTLRPA
jgi:hypothetical protein